MSNQIFIMNYLFDPCTLITSPFFLHLTWGSGCPFGGTHSNKALSPAATTVSTGVTLKSSRKTEKITFKINYILYLYI